MRAFTRVGEVAATNDGRLMLVRSYNQGPLLFALEAWPGLPAAAAMLVAERYAREGLVAAEPQHATASDDDGRRVTFLAQRGGRAFGTLTLTLARAGQPLRCESAFPDALSSLRASAGCIAEVGPLATDDTAPEAAQAMCAVFHLALVYALQCRVDDLVAEVHPRHAPVYQHLLGFKRASSDVRTCPRVMAPAVLLHGQLTELQERLARARSSGSGRSVLRTAFTADDEARMRCELQIAGCASPDWRPGVSTPVLGHASAALGVAA